MVDLLREARDAFYNQQAEMQKPDYFEACDLDNHRVELIALALAYIQLLETSLRTTQELLDYHHQCEHNWRKFI